MSEQVYSGNLLPTVQSIVFKLCEFKREKLCFEILSTIVNFYKLEQVKDILFSLIPGLVNVLEKLEQEKSSTYRDFQRNLLVFLSKLLAKYDFENICGLLENLQPNYTLYLYRKLLPSLIDIEELVFKRLVIQQYCIILGKYCAQIGEDVIIDFTKNLLISLEAFYKISTLWEGEKKIEVNDIFISASNASIKLKNLDIPVNF